MAYGSSISASAPGTLMVLGEHAVLHGKRAIAGAVNLRIRVTARPRSDGNLTIESTLGRFRAPMTQLGTDGPFRFTTSVAAGHAEALPAGAELVIESDFSHQVGLGSSAAVTVATAAVLHALAGAEPAPTALFDECLAAVHAVQGSGSGSDLAACIRGGLVLYRVAPRLWEPLPHAPDITLVYSGAKTPTPEVIRFVEAKRRERPAAFEALFEAMDISIDEARNAIARADWLTLGGVMRENQDHMRALGVSNKTLEAIVALLEQDTAITGAKISGSGLGDCVLGIGRADLPECPYPILPVAISKTGLSVD